MTPEEEIEGQKEAHGEEDFGFDPTEGVTHSTPDKLVLGERVEDQMEKDTHDEEDFRFDPDEGVMSVSQLNSSDHTSDSKEDTSTSENSGQSSGLSTASSTTDEEYDEDSDESSSQQDDVELLVDEHTDELFLYDGSQITTFALGQILNELQRANSESDRGMTRIYSVIKALLPPPEHKAELPTLPQLKRMLLKKIPRVQRIHVCSADCVMFIGEFKDLKRCPVSSCRRKRYFQDKSGYLVPVNVYRSIPIASQLRLRFAQKKQAPDMRLSASLYDGDDDKQVNDITESLGFREVVVNSGFLTDCRNPILILGTDGANPFARERVSTYQLWPMICALANIPRLRRYKSANLILCGLVSGHVYVNGVKKNRSVKNLRVYIQHIMDQVLELNTHRMTITDASYAVNAPQRTFTPSVMLLCTLGDFDAHTHLLCTVPAGSTCCCIKCNIKGEWYASISTRVFAQHRRYIDAKDPRRQEAWHGVTEQRGPPAPRTREQALSHGQRIEQAVQAVQRKERGAKSNLDRMVTKWGITGLCPLLQLPDFDPHDRSMIDLMHLLKNLVWNHLVRRMLGLCSAPPVPRNEMKVWDETKRAQVSKKKLQARNAQYEKRKVEVQVLSAKREHIITQDRLWEMTTQAKEAASNRMKSLICPVAFYSHSKNLFEFSGSWDTILWQHFVERSYLFLALFTVSTTNECVTCGLNLTRI